MNKHIYNFLRNPIVVFAAMGLGILLGIFYPEFSLKLQGFGEVYLVLIGMTVLPILVSAIISSVGNFVQHPVLYKLTFYAFKIVVLSMFIVVSLSLAAGFVFKPGELPDEQQKVLSEYIGENSTIFEFELYGDQKSTVKEGFVTRFLKILIPGNILGAFMNNNALALAFISIVIGVSAGLLSSAQHGSRQSAISGNVIIEFFENFFKVFQVVIGWTLTLIPIALVCIIASQVAGFGLTIISTTIRLIALFYILGGTLIIINGILAGYFSGKGVFNVFKASLYPTLIGFTTKNSIAAIPSSIQSLSTNLKLNASFSQLLVPLFVILCRYGNLAWFGLVSVFAAQIYGINLSVIEIIVLMVGLVISVVATAGSTGFATLSVITIPLVPLGLPAETILLILYAIDPIVDPLRSALIVQTNFCTASLVCSKQPSDNNATEIAFSQNVEVIGEVKP